MDSIEALGCVTSTINFRKRPAARSGIIFRSPFRVNEKTIPDRGESSFDVHPNLESKGGKVDEKKTEFDFRHRWIEIDRRK